MLPIDDEDVTAEEDHTFEDALGAVNTSRKCSGSTASDQLSITFFQLILHLEAVKS